MSDAIANYRKMVEQPWGRMFYDLIYRQLNLQNGERAKILDFGAGFCITAKHYAQFHDVTAMEPNEEMCSLRFQSDEYTLVKQGIDYLPAITDNTYDVAICHNVLEYADNKDEILNQLVRVLKPNGTLSIVKHNLFGRAMGFAVLNDNPKAALDILSDDNTEDSMFGNRNVYSNETLIDFLADKMELTNTFGIRAFFWLSSNNEIKFTDEWYNNMLELETKAGAIDDFKRIAFFNHLIFKKRT